MMLMNDMGGGDKHVEEKRNPWLQLEACDRHFQRKKENCEGNRHPDHKIRQEAQSAKSSVESLLRKMRSDKKSPGFGRGEKIVIYH